MIAWQTTGPGRHAEKTFWHCTLKDPIVTKRLVASLPRGGYGIVSPDGTLLAVVTEDPDELELRPLRDTSAAPKRTRVPTGLLWGGWSPEGRKVLFWALGDAYGRLLGGIKPGRFFAVDVETMTVKQIPVKKRVLPTCAAWLSEDTVLVAAEAALWSLNPETGELQKVWDAPPEMERQYD